MADKNINFNIKVNGQELDLTKASFKQFDDVIKQAQKDLKALPLSDPQYKVLSSEINDAEKAWKAATEAATNFGNEVLDDAEKVKSFRTEIKELTLANRQLEQQGQKNSEQYAKNQQKIKELKDAQEEFQRTTQKLDDSLANLPGPLGKVGQSMQQAEVITQSASSAFSSLTSKFPALKNAWVATGIGGIVIVVGTLVAAVMDAAKSFKPLQDAFAGIGDAVSSFFEVLKPVTDFILGTFVAGIKVITGALNMLTESFGKVSTGFKQMSLDIDRQLKNTKETLDLYNNDLNEWTKKGLDIEQNYLNRKKAIAEDDKKTTAQKNADLKVLDLKYADEKKNLEIERANYYIKLENDRNKKTNAATVESMNNRREAGKTGLELDKMYGDSELKNQKILSENKVKTLQESYDNINNIIDKSNKAIAAKAEQERKQAEANANGKKIIYPAADTSAILSKEEIAAYQERQKVLKSSISEEKTAQFNLNYDLISNQVDFNKRKAKLQQDASYEDRKLIAERFIEQKQAEQEIIKNDERRAYNLALVNKAALENQHTFEIEEANRAGVTLKGIKEKQAAELAVADEKIRKAQLVIDASLIQDEIEKQKALATLAANGSEEYFKAKEAVINKSYEKEKLIADDNTQELQRAEVTHYNALIEIMKEKIAVRTSLHQKESEVLLKDTDAYFEKLRQLENDRFEAEQIVIDNNYAMLEAAKKAHAKKMEDIDDQQLQSSISLLERKANTEQKTITKHYEDLRTAEVLKYQLDLKNAGDNAQAIETIEAEHTLKLKQYKEQQIQDVAAVGIAIGNSLANLTNALGAVYEAEANDTKKSMEQRKAAFEKNKQYQIATALLSAASGEIQILTQPSTLPSPFDWIVKGVNAAALAILTTAQISKIQSTQFNGGGSGGGDTINRGKNYATGGMITGPSHAQGGVPINAEGGEAIMTKGAVKSFGSILSMMNQVGGGTSFNNLVGQAPNDYPNSINSPTEPQIIKTYIVEQDLTSIQEKQARLKSLSTL